MTAPSRRRSVATPLGLAMLVLVQVGRQLDELSPWRDVVLGLAVLCAAGMLVVAARIRRAARAARD